MTTRARPDDDETLRVREERYRLATEAGHVGIWDWNIETDRVLWSDTLYEMHGVHPGEVELTVAGFQTLVHPDDRVVVEHSLTRALERGDPYEFEFRAIRPDGEVVWLYTNARVIRHEGRPVRMLGATVDITERKRVELALRESEERFAKAFNSAPLALTISSLVSGKLVAVNDTFVDVTGFSREETIGKTTADLGLWARPGDREAELAAVAAAGKLRNLEYVFRVRDGRDIVGLLSAETIVVGGEPCALTVIQDITDRKKFEQALREADRRKDEFLATLAHELRNPLAPIRNGIEVLKLGAGDPAQNAKVLDMMDRQLGQMVRLVDDLLDVSRISRGKIELRTEPVELAAVIRSAVETSRPVVEAAGHRLAVNVPRTTVLVDADLTRLSQVVANLLNNATRYTPPGGTVEVSVETEAGEAVVRVRDNGIGIAPDVLPQIFDLFVQADRSLEKSQSGLGIGLTIVKRLVEMHGGSVEASSAGAGQGSEFVVRLPLHEQSASESQAVRASTPQGPRRRVLVVDDNQDSADSMAMMLRVMGHETRAAHDGREGVDLAASFRPELILLDIGMPGMNGYDVCREIRKQPWSRDVSIVAMTGWGQDSDRERSREAGFDHHLTKPVEIETLKRVLAERAS